MPAPLRLQPNPKWPFWTKPPPPSGGDTPISGVTIPLDPVNAVSSATLALSAPTQIPLQASSATASATLALSAQTQIPLQAASATASATLALRAPTQIPLQASSGVCTDSLTIVTPQVVPLQAASGVASATLALTAPTKIPLGAAAGQSSATLALTAQTQIPLQAASAISSATLVLTAGVPIVVLSPANGQSSATLALTAPVVVLPFVIGWFLPGTMFSAYPANDVEAWIEQLREDREPGPVPEAAIETQTIGADGTASFTTLTPGHVYAFIGLVPTRVQAQWGTNTVLRYKTFEGAV